MKPFFSGLGITFSSFLWAINKREGEQKERERGRDRESEKEKQFTTLQCSELDGIHPDTHDMAIDYLIRKALVCFHGCDTH